MVRRKFLGLCVVALFISVIPSMVLAGSLKALSAGETITALKKEIDGLGKQIILKKKEGADIKELKGLVQAYEAKKKLMGELASALEEGRKDGKKGLAGLISGEKVTRHWDPNFPGHKHKCAKCGKMYNQPGDNAPTDFYSGRCPHCGFENEVPGGGQSGSSSASQQPGSAGSSGPAQEEEADSGLINANGRSVQCARCNGSGRLVNQICDLCEGDGWNWTNSAKLVKCKECNGLGMSMFQNCMNCNGFGYLNMYGGVKGLLFKPGTGYNVPCVVCNGHGVFCYACGGDGYVWTPVKDPKICGYCKGKGLLQGGFLKCRGCDGTGMANAIAGIGPRVQRASR